MGKMQTIKNDNIKGAGLRAFALYRKHKTSLRHFKYCSKKIWIAKREVTVLFAIIDGFKILISIKRINSVY